MSADVRIGMACEANDGLKKWGREPQKDYVVTMGL